VNNIFRVATKFDVVAEEMRSWCKDSAYRDGRGILLNSDSCVRNIYFTAKEFNNDGSETTEERIVHNRNDGRMVE